MSPIPSRFGRGRALLALVLVLVPLYGARLGASPLFDRDEAFYVGSAREMAARGGWITPWFNDQPRFDKPILYYWLQLGSRALLGETELAARLPSALAALALVLGLFVALEGLVGTAAAFAAALALGIAGETVVLARLGIPDATFALFLTGSWLVAFAWLDGLVAEKRSARVLGVLLGLAILTKGVVAPVLLALTAAGYRAWTGPFRARIALGALVQGAIAMGAVAAPWFLVETCIEGWEFPKTFFFRHHLERFVSGLPGHSKPWWYFASNIPFLFLPPILYVPAALARLRRSDPRPDAAVAARLARWAVVWLVTVVVFFSLSRGKLANYVFPALPAAAILAGLAIEARWSGREPLGRTERAVVWLFGLAAVTFVAVSGPAGDWIRTHLNDENREQLMDLGWLPLLPAACFAALAWMAQGAITRGQARRAIALLASGFAAIAVLGGSVVMPELGERSYGPTRDLARRIGTVLAREPGQLVQYRVTRPTMVFYARHPVVFTKARAVLDVALEKPQPVFVATLRKHLATDPMPGLVELGGTARVVVLGNESALAGYREVTSRDGS